MYGLIKILRSLLTFKDINFLQITQFKLITFQRYKKFTFMYKYQMIKSMTSPKNLLKPPH